MNKILTLWLQSLAMIVLLGACSIGGGETGTGFNGTPQTTEGVITGFGSVYINGIRYTTNNATVLDDDVATNEEFLKVGMLVTLEGSVDSANGIGQATTIRFERDVEGEVLENNYLVDKTLNIMGQTIHIDNDTIFDSNSLTVTSFESIVAGNVIEVSGFSDGTGDVYATRIEVKADTLSVTDEVEIKGQVTDLNGTVFSIGSLKVDSKNSQFQDMQSSDLANGLVVKIKSKQPILNGVLMADLIKLKESELKRRNETEDEELELEGAVTEIDGENAFYVNGRRFQVDNSTKFENISLASLVVGMRVKVHALITTNNVIIAKEVETKKTSSTKTEGTVTSINLVNKQIIVNGVALSVNTITRFKDDSDSSDDEKRYFNFADLNVGDKLELSFYVDTNTGSNIVTRLERKDKSDETGSGSEETSGNGDEGNGNDNPDDSTGSGDDGAGDDGDNRLEDNKLAWETRGIISNLDTTNSTFLIEGLTVDYSRVPNLEMLQLSNGKEAEIHGLIENGTWFATEIDIEDESE